VSPLKRVFSVGRFRLQYWHGWRFWKWLPNRHAYGPTVTYYAWLCFQIAVEPRYKDVIDRVERTWGVSIRDKIEKRDGP